MGRAKKVVLAYSGGVDTSVCIPYLKQEWGVEDVITFAADLGQGDELEPIRQKALDAGASQSLVGDLIEPFIKDCLLYTSPSPRDKRQSRMPSSA